MKTLMASPWLPLLFLLFSTSLMAAPSHHHSRVPNFLQCLSLHFPNSTNSIAKLIYTPHNSNYTSVLKASLRNQRFALPHTPKPKVIVTPLEVSQIQAAVYCSKESGLPIRVRSGGHDYEGLSYVSYESQFVMVDLINFRSVDVNVEKGTAWVQSGATLGELYYGISQKTNTYGFTAGVCPTVGIGGHFSGGGYGMMSRKYGLSVDNIIDARLVDVNGKILDRKAMGEDLFWAIRGGGGASFGVILEWQIKLLPVPETVTVFTVNRTLEQNGAKLIHRWQYIADKLDENILLRLFITTANSSSGFGKLTTQGSFVALYLGRAEKLVELMKESFPELGLERQDCFEMSWIESILYFAGFDGYPREILLNRTYDLMYFKGKSDYVLTPISEEGLEIVYKMLNEIDGTQALFSPFGGELAEISDSATPYAHRSGVIYNIHWGTGWKQEGREEYVKHMKWIRRLYKAMEPYVSKNPRQAYLNYRDLDLGVNNKGNTSYEQASTWALHYYKDNFKRLVEVKRKVDPRNFFRNEQSIPPAAV
uniref:Carbohydrate n=1 Tax=Diospyros kaki TaxID=35925 RepID=H1A8N0_DIOKA|nr:carbohydrate [Diospyros kaki]